MAHLNIEKITTASRDRQKEDQKKYLRKKYLFILISKYLEENGLVQTADMLKSESKFSISDFVVCDNINLESILQDFESYHFLRYQKLPQIVRKDLGNKTLCTSINDISNNNRIKSASKCFNMPDSHKSFLAKGHIDCSTSKTDKFLTSEDNSWQFDPFNVFENHSPEWKYLSSVVMQDVIVHQNKATWTSIVGHEKAKQFLKEAVVYPLKYKDLFNATFEPWKSILLFGPTGTGKTSLAMAAASESKAAFFNVCVSTITSKWRGESEKLVKVLFHLAKYYAPSIIFIDEIDSLMSHRGADHEASRRLKTEFFTAMDSVLSSDKVFVLAATNMPWELDYAVLRRMEKRLMIPLPDFNNRVLLFKKMLPDLIYVYDNVSVKADLNYENLALSSENFSASDIEIACKESKMALIRQLLEKLENCSDKISIKHININNLSTSDVLHALSNTKPSNTCLTAKYNNWKDKYSSE